METLEHQSKYSWVRDFISFLSYPLIWFINRFEYFIILVLAVVTISQTNLAAADVFSKIKYVTLIVFAGFELLLFLLLQLDCDRCRIRPSWHLTWALGLVGYFLLNSFLSMNMIVSLTKTISVTILFFTTLWLIPILSGICNRKQKIIDAIYTYIVFVLLLNFFAFFIKSSFAFSSQSFIRFGGIFENPNSLGLFVTASLPFIFYKLKRVESKKFRIFNLCLIVYAFILIVLSFSRASLLASGLFLVVMLYFFYPKAFKIITIVMIIAILVVLSSPLLMELLRLADDPFTAREKLWQIALESWKHHRLLGTGFGTANLITESTYLLYTHKVTAFLLGSHFHNMYLEILSETGIIGFSFFVFLLSSFFIKSIKVIRQSIEPDRILAISFFGLLVGVSILCFFESAILSAGTVPSIVFWLLGGLVLSDPSPSSLNPL